MGKELNKQTAVQWFIEQLEQKGDASENIGMRRIQISIDVSDYLELKRQAKQMGKEQMIKFALHLHYVDMSLTGTDILMAEAEHYYEQTYGGNK